jgi:hypothetical protein
MKKLLYSIITMIYLLVATGIGINVHYCMGEIASVEFHENESKSCNKCGMEERKGGCCSNEKQFYKYDDSYKSKESSNIVFSDVEWIAQSNFNWGKVLATNIQFESTFPLLDPEPEGPPIYLRNNVFLI